METSNIDRAVRRIREIPRWIWILGLIMLVGIFVRTYRFHDWLQFSPDEARDATLVGAAVTGTSPLPYMGPQAGNTRFNLGPLYYQAEYVAARMFGNLPDRIAYPDLFFSILAIPMLFIFLRRYFERRLSLGLTAILSVSYFAVQISRFASNPNSIPFFVLLYLYGLLELMNDGVDRRKYAWAAAVGIGMGVGIQLHALLFVIMPVVSFGVCVYLLAKSNFTWTVLFIVIGFAALMNFGQLASEIRTGGSNVSQFVKGAGGESDTGGGALVRNTALIAACQTQANIAIVFTPVSYEECGQLFRFAKAFRKDAIVPGGATANGLIFILETLVGTALSFGGYSAVLARYRREIDVKRRRFLGLLLFYNAVSLLVLIPVASQVSVRYFNILFFVPFVLLGILLEPFAGHETVGWRKRIFQMTIPLMLIADVLALAVAARPYIERRASDVDNSILGEIEPMVAYMIEHTDQAGLIRLDGKATYVKRFLKPFDYLSRKSGVVTVRPPSGSDFPSGTRYFYINGLKSSPEKAGGEMEGNMIVGVARFGNIVVYSLIKS